MSNPKRPAPILQLTYLVLDPTCAVFRPAPEFGSGLELSEWKKVHPGIELCPEAERPNIEAEFAGEIYRWPGWPAEPGEWNYAIRYHRH